MAVIPADLLLQLLLHHLNGLELQHRFARDVRRPPQPDRARPMLRGVNARRLRGWAKETPCEYSTPF